MLGADALFEQVQFADSLRQRCIAAQPSENHIVVIASPTVIEVLDGQEDLGALGQAGQRAKLAVLRKAKGGRQDSGDGTWRSIQADGLADEARRAAKPPPPKA